MKLSSPISFVACTLGLVLTLTACTQPNISITVDRDLVQERVAKKFPQEHDLKGLATLTLSNPEVDLTSTENRIILNNDMELARPGIPLVVKGKSKTSGTIRYVKESHTFMMSDVRVEEIDLPIKILNPKRKQQLVDLTNATLQSSFKDIPIHSLETAASRSAADALLKEVKIKDGKLQITMGGK